MMSMLILIQLYLVTINKRQIFKLKCKILLTVEKIMSIRIFLNFKSKNGYKHGMVAALEKGIVAHSFYGPGKWEK